MSLYTGQNKLGNEQISILYRGKSIHKAKRYLVDLRHWKSFNQTRIACLPSRTQFGNKVQLSLLVALSLTTFF